MDFEHLLSSPVHPAIAAAARYFQELAPGDGFPMRHDFRPTRIPALLGYYFLIDVLPDDYRYGLIGEHISLLFGIDGTNILLSEFADAALRARLKNSYDAVVKRRSFQYVRGRYTWPERSVNIERLLVPLADHDGRLSTILGVSIPEIRLETLNLFAGIGAATLEIDTEIDG